MEGTTIEDMPNTPAPPDAVGGGLAWDENLHKSDPAGSPAALKDAGGGDGSSDLERLIRLFTNEDTAEINERQLVVLRQVCKVRPRGFRYGELALVERLLPLVESRVSLEHKAGEFRGPLLKLLDICSLAPVRDRANQEFTERGLHASSSLFSTVGALLWSPDPVVQSAAADVLRKIAAGNDPTRPNTPDGEENVRFGECRDDLRPKPKDINQALLLGCGVVTSAVACLGKVMGDVLASFTDLDDSSSLDSSSFGETADRGVDVVLSECDPAAAAAATATVPDGGFDASEGAELDDDEDVNSTATKANGDDFDVKGTKVEGGGEGGRRSTDLAKKRAVLLSLLQLVRELSTDANSSAAMVEEGIVTLLVQVMQAVRGIRDQTLSITVEVMWNCLEHSQNAMDNAPPGESRTGLIRKARKSNAAFALSSWSGLSALRDSLEALLIGGFRNKDKELRNEAVIVASQLSSNGRSHPLFRRTGMLLLLLRYATAIETGLADGNPHAAESEARTFSVAGTEGSHGGSSGVGGGSGGGGGGGGGGSIEGLERAGLPELGPLADPRNFATTKEVDMELKLLLWSLLTDLCKRDARNVEIVNASPLMETLLMYMDLVVEEGQSGDALPPGMSRSISLSSIPASGNKQQTSPPTAISPTTPTLPREAGGEDSTRRLRTAESDLGRSDPTSVAPFSGNSPAPSVEVPTSTVSDVGQTNGRKQQRLTASGEDQTADAAGGGPARQQRASSSASRVGETPEVGGFTQIFVPASVFRLPVTSIQLLQGQAMASLLVLAPRCPKKFQALGGHMVTLRLLDRLGSRADTQRLVKLATKMLATVVSLPGLKEELGRVDGVRIMLDRFSEEWKRAQHGVGGGGGGAGGSSVGSGGASGGGGAGGGGGSAGDGASDVRTDMVIILCRLCEDCPENQEAFRKADGVPIMMAAVKAYCRARSEAKQQEGANSGSGGDGGADGGTRDPGGSSLGGVGGLGGVESGGSSGESLDPALVHIIDCVWCAVVGNRRSEARLLQCEGLDTLLDLLELCPVFMRHQVTGIVADLLRNKRSIPYARAWRSDLNMLSITQLMVRLWVAEESRLGVSRPNGVLQNLWQPLQSHDRGRGLRNLKKTPARRGRSTPTGRDASADPSLKSSGGDCVTADIRSSATINDSRDSALAVAVSCTAPSTPSADIVNGTAGSTASTSEGWQELGGAADAAAHDAKKGCSLAVALALEACKRAVAIGQGSGGGGQRKKASQMGAEASVAKAMMNLDLRGKIAAVLGMVGFDGSTTDGLGPTDLKASYMATSYMDFRAGAAWQAVAAELEAQQINPIAADALVLDTMLERAFDCAQEVKSKQMALTVEQGERDAETEEAFFAGILFQRDQEIRQAIIKRNALLPGASKKRLAAKKAKADMLKRSSERSQGGSSDRDGAPEDEFELNATDVLDHDAKGQGAGPRIAASG